jgi:hypothetical protein
MSMLGSMNPLVLRARHGHWWTTATAYIVSAILGGALTGWLLGVGGEIVRADTNAPPWRTAVAILGACGLVGALVDSGVHRMRVPSIKRQVDEGWRYRYRNWIYAVGYGFQIGLGFTTIVTTATVYATFIAMFLLASQPLGIAVGVWFGFTRSVSVLSVAGVRNLGQFESIQAVLTRWYVPSRILTVAGQAALGGALVVLVAL